jgi:hypothetical protein
VTPELLITVLIPAIGGLAVGFSSGFLTGILATLRWVAQRRDRGQTMPTYRDSDPEHPQKRPLLGGEHLSIFGVFLASVATLALIAGVISLAGDRAISDCLSGHATDTAVASTARAEAGDIDRAADKQIRDATQDSIDAIVNIFDVPRDLSPEDRQRTTDEYKARFARNRDAIAAAAQQKGVAEQIRDANPLPPPPAC